MSFKEKYSEIYDSVRPEIEQVTNRLFEDLEASSPLLQDKLKTFFSMPSKHIRALISFLYLKARGFAISDEQVSYQSVIEIIHNASLIHDDIIDEADKRRGSKSFNADFGNHISVIAGDLILAIALKRLAELNRAELIFLVSDTISKMCNGEIAQEFSKFSVPSLEDYIEKTYNKTGSLFEAAICGAELISNGFINENTRSFSKNFGIAFQLRDDILNIVQNASESDISNGIYTAPVILSEKFEVTESGLEKAKGLLNNYISKAKEFIQFLEESKYKTAIINLLELIKNE